ncbi:MAG: transglycosylase domain-containing protein, partial [Longimonas sp.]
MSSSDSSFIESFTEHPATQRVGAWGQAVAGWIRSAPPWTRALMLTCALSVPLVLLIRAELRTSYLQSTLLSQYASGLTYQVDDGPSPSIRFPTTGPFNERLGYVALPAFIDSLTQRGRFAIARQARVSDRFATHMDIGLAPPYVPKQQTGLDVLDRSAVPLASARYPQRVYAAPDSIPRLARETLLFIENRALLGTAPPRKNPAIEWRRFAYASGRQLSDALGLTEDGPGGSTLATQLDKVRNSPGGQTAGPIDKLRQMASASVQSYLHGPETIEARRRLVAEYLNLLPLAAIAGHGEVNGLGDGLWAWYNTDLDTVNRHLRAADTTATPSDAQALAYRQVLQLILSTRSPSRFFLSEAGHEALTELADAYLPVLAEAGIISPDMRDAALANRPERRTRAVAPATESFIARKAASATRIQLLQQLSMPSLPALDRLDLTTHTHYDASAQRAVAGLLERLQDPAFVREAGLAGPRMLDRGDPSLVEYAVVLYERDSTANVVRLQADTFDGPFDINRGAKLELGSTAKLRTLVTYLELIDELYDTHAGRSADSLQAVPVANNDALSRWALGELQRNPALSRRDLLDAAMNRRYSASPYERFFTGGGQHRFSNFSTASDSLRPTVTTAFRQSINLP